VALGSRDRRPVGAQRGRNRDAFVEVRRPDRLARILHRLLQARARRRIESILARLHPADLAKIMTFLPISEARNLVQHLFHLRKAAATLSELPGGYAEELVRELAPELTAELIRRLDPDDAVSLLKELPGEHREKILNILNIEEVTELERLLSYHEETAGALMNPEYFAVSIDLDVQSAIEYIRTEGDKLESVFYVYVVDEWNKLIGTVSMRDLLLADPPTALREVVDTHVVSVATHTSEDEVAEMIAKYDLLALPVVDEGQRLIGVITVDDVIDVLQESATEELYSMVLLDEDDRAFSPARRSIRLRFPWLIVNLGTALLAAATVGLFEDVLGQVVALAALMPMVAGQGGNAGTQTLTVVIRGLALGEIRAINVSRVIAKELAVGAVNGILVGILAGAIAWWWKGQWWLGAILTIAMFLNLCIAALGGSMIPLLLRRLNLDPALGSSIFLTTLTDVFGFFCFLGLAHWLLPIFGVVG